LRQERNVGKWEAANQSSHPSDSKHKFAIAPKREGLTVQACRERLVRADRRGADELESQALKGLP